MRLPLSLTFLLPLNAWLAEVTTQALHEDHEVVTPVTRFVLVIRPLHNMKYPAHDRCFQVTRIQLNKPCFHR